MENGEQDNNIIFIFTSYYLFRQRTNSKLMTMPTKRVNLHKASSSSDTSDDELYADFAKYKAKTIGDRSNKRKKAQIPAEADIIATSNCSPKSPNADEYVKVLEEDEAIIFEEEIHHPRPKTMPELNPLFSYPEPAIIELSIHNVRLSSSVENSKSDQNQCTLNIVFKGETKPFICDMEQPVIHVIHDLAARTNTDPERITLYDRHIVCDSKKTPCSLGFKSNAVIDLEAFEELEPITTRTIKIKYQMKGKRPVLTDVIVDATFAVLKRNFCTDNGLNPTKTVFLLGSERLGDEETPESVDLENGDCIDVYEMD